MHKALTPRQRQLVPRNRPLQQHVAAKAKKLGRAACGGGGHLAGFFDQGLLFDQAAKVLFVQAATDRKFNRMRPSMARVLGLETRSAKAG